ncbi:unnamed protein product [Linum trigynum]|uniref:Uncharacterized protein n=1 Tax=Linum trigynum TaxID=586398 RepID=A0AAV2CYD9_9ROSI
MSQFASFSLNWGKKRTCVMEDASPSGGRGGGDGFLNGVESGGTRVVEIGVEIGGGCGCPPHILRRRRSPATPSPPTSSISFTGS